MKMLGIMFLLSAIFITIIIFICRYCLDKNIELEFKLADKEYEIKRIKQELEEAKDNEVKARRISNWNTDAVKKEYENRLKEILKDIEYEARCYGNPVIALNNIRSKIRIIGGGDTYESIKKDIS